MYSGPKFAKVNETTHTNYNRTFAGMKYNINGGGRDTYIYQDNGGFRTRYEPRTQDKPGNFLPTVNRQPDAAIKFSNVKEQAKSIRYKTDGTGRDSYVNIGDGGFTNPYKVVALDPRIAFRRSLRGYEQDADY